MQGHEMATHSISHNNTEEYWSKGSKETWALEMGGGKDILEVHLPIQFRTVPVPSARRPGFYEDRAVDPHSFVQNSNDLMNVVKNQLVKNKKEFKK